MKCFSFRHKKAGQGSSKPRHRSAPDAAPSTTNFFTAASNRSNVETGTSSSYCSSAATLAQQTSKSVDSSVASPRSMPALYEERAHNLRVFDYRELRSATDNFSRLRKIGEGGFGSVYKGVIKPASDGQGDETVVAIKRLNQDGLQGHRQWLAEVQFLAVVDHPNLVKLLGYCALDGERGIDRLLVYEFMPNKSLEDHLFNKAYPVLPWDTRLKIILGVAQGLDYLHEGLEVQVIYRDFKASNVLLDEDFRPKLSDFGLAREGPSDGRTHVTTAVVGTYGYAAPEYVETGHLTTKSDVWSFGVVLYEILTGRRSLNRNLPKTEQKLLNWVKQFPVDSRRFFTVIDPRLGNQYSRPAARVIAKLANSCLLKNQKERPTIKEVIEHLKNAVKLTEISSPDPEPVEEQHSSGDLEGEEKGEQVGPTKSFQRRIEHLGRMRESLKVENKRGFMIMQRGNHS